MIWHRWSCLKTRQTPPPKPSPPVGAFFGVELAAVVLEPLVDMPSSTDAPKAPKGTILAPMESPTTFCYYCGNNYIGRAPGSAN